MFKLSPRIVLCYLWVALLAFSFYVSVRSSYREALSTEEFAYACDPFGYLRMAKQIRYAASRGAWPEFKIESPQTRQLINFLQYQNLPVQRWEDVVAPHAHHYFAKTGDVGVQYPPGTGLVLAMFPQGEAVYDLNRLVVLVFVVVGIGALVFAAWKQAWASIGLVVLALSVGLMVLGRVGFLSFSINAVLVPVLLTCLLSLFALWSKTASRDRLALLCALLAGLSLGLATLIRLPSFLLLPGFLVLLWPGFRQVRVKSLTVAFVIGVVVTGVIPVLVNQQVVAGAWYQSTYVSVDAAAPTFERWRSNFAYFLKDGPGSVDNWSLVYALVGFVGFLMLYSRRDSNRLGLSWKRLALAAFLLWFVSICYFLTHEVTAPYYMIPAVFAAVALIGFGALGIEATSMVEKRFDPRRVLSWVALALILWPGIATFNRVWSNRFTGPVPVRASTHAPVLIPSELVDDKAWIWADLLTGSLWYYANKPAFKIDKTDEEVRATIFRWVFERGDRQYLIQDSEQMKKYMAEIEQLGGQLEPRGKVDGQPYFLVVWPSRGPSISTHFTD
jgi:hypothetical protein